MSDESKKELMVRLQRREEAYRSDFGFWLKDQVITIDETKRAALPWPQDKVYLDELAWALQYEPRIAIPKSRRMMISWILLAYSCWRLRFEPNHAAFWQSENFAKACFSVKRIKTIEDQLRYAPLRKNYETRKGGDDGIARIKYSHKEGDSWMLAVAQGASVLNAYTVSFLILDECEFQPYARETMANVMPLLESGVQIILCSSSNGPSGVMAGWMRDIGFRSWKDRP
jgi:hypothetical protein